MYWRAWTWRNYPKCFAIPAVLPYSQLKVIYLCDWFLKSVDLISSQCRIDFSKIKLVLTKFDQMVSSRIIDLIQILHSAIFKSCTFCLVCDICILCSVYHSSNVTLGGQTGQSCEHRRVNKLNTKFAPKLNSIRLKWIALLDVISSASNAYKYIAVNLNCWCTAVKGKCTNKMLCHNRTS